ncbi:hypothetical protein AB9W56_004544 [Vibrio vulnificus]|nr:hypothetical protein [Vibrio vulnificus]
MSNCKLTEATTPSHITCRHSRARGNPFIRAYRMKRLQAHLPQNRVNRQQNVNTALKRANSELSVDTLGLSRFRRDSSTNTKSPDILLLRKSEYILEENVDATGLPIAFTMW